MNIIIKNLLFYSLLASASTTHAIRINIHEVTKRYSETILSAIECRSKKMTKEDEDLLEEEMKNFQLIKSQLRKELFEQPGGENAPRIPLEIRTANVAQKIENSLTEKDFPLLYRINQKNRNQKFNFNEEEIQRIKSKFHCVFSPLFHYEYVETEKRFVFGYQEGSFEAQLININNNLKTAENIKKEPLTRSEIYEQVLKEIFKKRARNFLCNLFVCNAFSNLDEFMNFLFKETPLPPPQPTERTITKKGNLAPEKKIYEKFMEMKSIVENRNTKDQRYPSIARYLPSLFSCEEEDLLRGISALSDIMNRLSPGTYLPTGKHGSLDTQKGRFVEERFHILVEILLRDGVDLDRQKSGPQIPGKCSSFYLPNTLSDNKKFIIFLQDLSRYLHQNRGEYYRIFFDKKKGDKKKEISKIENLMFKEAKPMGKNAACIDVMQKTFKKLGRAEIFLDMMTLCEPAGKNLTHTAVLLSRVSKNLGLRDFMQYDGISKMLCGMVQEIRVFNTNLGDGNAAFIAKHSVTSFSSGSNRRITGLPDPDDIPGNYEDSVRSEIIHDLETFPNEFSFLELQYKKKSIERNLEETSAPQKELENKCNNEEEIQETDCAEAVEKRLDAMFQRNVDPEINNKFFKKFNKITSTDRHNRHDFPHEIPTFPIAILGNNIKKFINPFSFPISPIVAYSGTNTLDIFVNFGQCLLEKDHDIILPSNHGRLDLFCKEELKGEIKGEICGICACKELPSATPVVHTVMKPLKYFSGVKKSGNHADYGNFDSDLRRMNTLKNHPEKIGFPQSFPWVYSSVKMLHFIFNKKEMIRNLFPNLNTKLPITCQEVEEVRWWNNMN